MKKANVFLKLKIRAASDNLELFDAAIQLAASYKLGAIEVMDGLTFGFHSKTAPYSLERARANATKGNPDSANPTAIIGNCGHTQESANKEIGAGFADMITFGRPYISNPDLPERFAQGIALSPLAAIEDWWRNPVRYLAFVCLPEAILMFGW